MAYRVLSNRLNGKVALHFSTLAANSTIIVVGNNSVSNLCVNSTSSEVINGAMIRRVVWGTDANWQILRGANVVIVLSQSGDIDLEDLGENLDPAANIVITTTSANGFLIMQLDKDIQRTVTVY